MYRIYLLSIATILFTSNVSVLADGAMLIPRITYDVTGIENVSSGAQKALLIWQDNIETLHLQSSYEGPVSDFAWIIPVPDRPKIERSDLVLLEQAEKMTRPKVKVLKRELFSGIDCACAATNTASEKTLDTGVLELETLKIRELHIDIVSANESGGFIRWLEKNNYAIPDKAGPVLKHYIDKNFYFIVVKIDKSGEWALKKGFSRTISGGLTPIAISFNTPFPFYPLEISSISSAQENELLLLSITRENIVPAEYNCDRLKNEDVRDTLGPIIYRSKDPFKTKIEFSPAVKAAQKRIGGPSIIIEFIAQAGWADGKQQKLVQKNQDGLGENLRITRFHSFMKPEDMKDIFFKPSQTDSLFEGYFYIEHFASFASNAAISYCPIIFGLVLWIIPKRQFRLKKLLNTLSLCFVLFGIII